MPSAPPKATEAIVAILVPPACREEVVGDLHERYQSPLHYCADAISTVPFVIASRIRRTSDLQILLVQAFSLFFAFLAAAWFKDRGFLKLHGSLLRLAIPAGVAVLGLILEDAYAKPGERSSLGLARGPLLGAGMALLAEGALRWLHPSLAIPGWTLAYGAILSLILTSAVRVMLPPAAQQLRGTNVPADWLKSPSATVGGAKTGLRLIQGVTAVVAAMVVATWIANQEAIPQLWVLAPMLFLAFVILIANQFWKRR
jgi:type IV secretory pathway TrbD component